MFGHSSFRRAGSGIRPDDVPAAIGGSIPWWWLAVLAGSAAIVGAGLLATAATPFDSGPGTREEDPKCAALARVVAGRSHSMFDAQRYRATERRVYGLCVADPAAFRRLARGY